MMKKFVTWFKSQWAKDGVKLVLFLLLAFLTPLIFNNFHSNDCLDIILITVSVYTCRNVFDDHYDAKWKYYFMGLLLVVVCVLGYSFISINFLNYSEFTLSVPLGFAIRMLTIFMVAYPFYEKYIKNVGKIEVKNVNENLEDKSVSENDKGQGKRNSKSKIIRMKKNKKRKSKRL